jgi:glucose-1-phosphate adenylyltransferase
MVRDAVLMEGVVVSAGAWVENCIIDEGVVIGKNSVIGGPLSEQTPITVIGQGIEVEEGSILAAGTRLSAEEEDGTASKHEMRKHKEKGDT